MRPWRIPNLGPSYSFHRNPFQRAGANQNIESNEYANIVLDVIYYYEQARRAGMTPLSEGQARTLRAWVKRALPAYWTHSGYMNWDTGLYLYRWHLSRYWAWSCQGLLAIATSQNFVDDDERRWAKHIFDRSLALYERFSERWDDDRREPGSSLYGITTKFSEGRHFELARFQALAAEAVLRGLGDKPAEEPPPLYAFDPADRPADRHDAELQHRDHGGQQRRVPLRRHRARAAVRLEAARRLPHRRAGAGRESGWSCARRAARSSRPRNGRAPCCGRAGARSR